MIDVQQIVDQSKPQEDSNYHLEIISVVVRDLIETEIIQGGQRTCILLIGYDQQGIYLYRVSKNSKQI